MAFNKRIAELLVKTGAYTDLDEPVILTSGQLGIYYVNTEKLAQDGGEFKTPKEHGWKICDYAQEMRDHAISMGVEHSEFAEVIDILAEKAQLILDGYPSNHPKAISGGQTRDWFFSAPVAYELGLNHVSIYKNGEMEVIEPNRGEVVSHDDLKGFQVLHIADLLTEGNSCYRQDPGTGEETGWVPYLRQQGADVTDLMTVVTRLQGGEENLASQGVTTHSFVPINVEFLEQHSNNPGRAIDYALDPLTSPGIWSEGYLRDNGALALVKAFDPAAKDDRALKFLGRYRTVLEDAGRFEELADAVQQTYDRDIR